MTGHSMDAARDCPRCGAKVEPTRLEGDDGATSLWRCTCGWAGARTESGVVDRRQVKAMIAAAEKKTGDG